MELSDKPSEVIFARGKLFELVHVEQPDGRVFEVSRRAPGVRLIIADKDQRAVLLTKEYRQELDAWDYRLPGGKVFDTLESYETSRSADEDIIVKASQKAVAESVEEAGIEVEDMVLFRKSTLGATVEWDLYIFEVLAWSRAAGGQRLELGEDIETDNWFSYDDATALIMDGGMREERVALVLLQWLHKQEQI